MEVARGLDLAPQEGLGHRGKRCGAILHSLALPHENLAAVEVDVLHAQAAAFQQPEPGPVEESGLEVGRACELGQQGAGLVAGQHHGKTVRAPRAHDVLEPRQVALEDLPVQEQESRQCLVLGRSGDASLRCEGAEERRDLGIATSEGLGAIGHDVNVFCNDGAGGFAFPAPIIHPVGEMTSDLVLSDLDGDGSLDGAIESSLYLGDGGGGLSLVPASVCCPGVHPSVLLRAGDFNLDGAADLAGYHSTSGVIVRLGDGQGSFGSPIPVPFSGTGVPSSVDVGDVTGDGNPDLLIGSPLSEVEVVLGDGSGGFSAGFVLGTGSEPTSALVADFDGDGRSDVASTTVGAYVSFLFNRCPLSLDVTQPGGAGAPILVQNGGMTPGREYFNVFSADACPSGPGTGPTSLFGLCICTPANAQAIIDQLMLPVGAAPFHFTANQQTETWGPFGGVGSPGLTVKAVSLEVINGAIGNASPVAALTIQ